MTRGEEKTCQKLLLLKRNIEIRQKYSEKKKRLQELKSKAQKLGIQRSKINGKTQQLPLHFTYEK